MITIDDPNDDDDTILISTTAVIIGLVSLFEQQCHEMAMEDEFIMQHVLPVLRRSHVNWYYALHRVYRQRQKWSAFNRDLTDRQFRRYFRMDKCLFQQLCHQIEDCVGAEVFKSEQYLER